MTNTVEKVCGSCKWFLNEDTNGKGECFVSHDDKDCGFECDCNFWESKVETVTDNHMLSIDELKDIDCPYCGYSIFAADLSDDDLQTLINTEHIPVDCCNCTGTYMIDINLQVEEVYKCRNCNDTGGWYEDVFIPGSWTGHSEKWFDCEYCEGRKDE